MSILCLLAEAAAAAAATAAAADEFDVWDICCAVFNAFDFLRTALEYSDNDGRRSSVISSTSLLPPPVNTIKICVINEWRLLPAK